MPSLIAYRKAFGPNQTHQLLLPQSPRMGEPAAYELATLADGRTVVCLLDDQDLPADQPDEIAPSIEHLPTPLPAELQAEIAQRSPQVRMINARVVEQIRSAYSIDDEIKLLRIAPSAETAMWNEHVEACRAWGRAEKAKFGL